MTRQGTSAYEVNAPNLPQKQTIPKIRCPLSLKWSEQSVQYHVLKTYNVGSIFDIIADKLTPIQFLSTVRKNKQLRLKLPPFFRVCSWCQRVFCFQFCYLSHSGKYCHMLTAWLGVYSHVIPNLSGWLTRFTSITIKRVERYETLLSIQPKEARLVRHAFPNSH